MQRSNVKLRQYMKKSVCVLDAIAEWIILFFFINDRSHKNRVPYLLIMTPILYPLGHH